MKNIWLLVFCAACSGQDTTDLNAVSINLKEASALEKVPGSSLYWIIEDSGNKSVVYGIDAEGKTKAELKLDNENNDWESLASDKEGNLYVGDFGNNDNDRKDLKIYKVSKEYVKDGDAKVSAVTNFSYPEQTEFPPAKNSRFFDCEAFIEYKGNFFLFTKNRSSGSDGSFNVYKVPNRAGNYKAQLIGKLTTCEKSDCQVTGADISSDGSKIILLTADVVYLLTNFSENDFNNAKMEALALKHNTQKEGICFKDSHAIMIVDEENKGGGGNMYEVRLQDIKRQS
jgi:hypothetical protein